jgi:hypothetical protein
VVQDALHLHIKKNLLNSKAKEMQNNHHNRHGTKLLSTTAEQQAQLNNHYIRQGENVTTEKYIKFKRNPNFKPQNL